MENPGEYRSFRTRRTIAPLVFPLLVSAFFFVLGFVLYGITREAASLAATAVGALLLLFLFLLALAPGTEYRLYGDRLLLRKGLAKGEVQFQELRGAARLSLEEASAILRRYMAPGIAGEAQSDLKTWYRGNRTYMVFVRFCGVPVMQVVATRGSFRNVSSFRAATSGEFVLLKLRSGAEHLISPDDCLLFMEALESRTVLEDRSKDSAFSWDEAAYLASDGLRRNRKFLRINTIASLTIILAVVAVLTLRGFIKGGSDGAAEPSAAGTVSASLKDEWVSEDEFRFWVSLEADTSAASDAAAKELVLADAVAEAYYRSAALALIREGRPGIAELPAEKLESAVLALKPFVDGVEPAVLEKWIDDAYNSIDVLVALKREGLRSEAAQRIAEVLAE